MVWSKERWVREWGKLHGCEFDWYIVEPPPELAGTLADLALPADVALDVGCGPGTLTAYLARRFQTVVGLDIAFGAVQEARQFTAQARGKTAFLVGAAPYFPFADNIFAFAFDRGCMHNLLPALWSPYLDGIGRILKPDGIFELFYGVVRAKTIQRYFAKTMLWSGSKVVPGSQRAMSKATFTQMLPKTLEILKLEYTKGSASSLKVLWMHAVVRRCATLAQ